MVTGYEAGAYRAMDRMAESLASIATSLRSIDNRLQEQAEKEQEA